MPCRAVNNLGFAKSALSHLFAPSKVEQTLHQTEGSFGGQVRTQADAGHQLSRDEQEISRIAQTLT